MAHPFHLFDCWHRSDFKCYKNKGLVVAWEDAEGCGWSVSLLSLKEESATKYTKEQGPAQRDWEPKEPFSVKGVATRLKTTIKTWLEIESFF